MQVPTGGTVRELLCSSRTGDFLCRENSGTDSIVWMREEIYSSLYDEHTGGGSLRSMVYPGIISGVSFLIGWGDFREDCLFQK